MPDCRPQLAASQSRDRRRQGLNEAVHAGRRGLPSLGYRPRTKTQSTRESVPAVLLRPARHRTSHDQGPAKLAMRTFMFAFSFAKAVDGHAQAELIMPLTCDDKSSGGRI